MSVVTTAAGVPAAEPAVLLRLAKSVLVDLAAQERAAAVSASSNDNNDPALVHASRGSSSSATKQDRQLEQIAPQELNVRRADRLDAIVRDVNDWQTLRKITGEREGKEEDPVVVDHVRTALRKALGAATEGEK